MDVRFCRNCANFEDRRDIDRVALCALHHGPSVCCQEFTPRDENVSSNQLYDRFCLNCANFEEIDGIPVCARHHRPGIACGGFTRKTETIEITT
jgi:hypothetical protein